MVKAALEYWISMDKDYHVGTENTLKFQGEWGEPHLLTSFGVEHPMGVEPICYIDVPEHALNDTSLGNSFYHAMHNFAKMLGRDYGTKNGRIYVTISFDKSVKIKGIPKAEGAKRTLFKNAMDIHIAPNLLNKQYISATFGQVAHMLEYELETGKEMW